MGIHHNIGFRSLAVNLRELRDRQAGGGNQIAKHIARADTGQLIAVADQNQVGADRHREEQRMEEP